jgi:hypothetical protein
MINPPLRRYMRSDATKLSTADYEDIMQYRDMKSKPLEQLRKKFHISSSRLYQIWRGQKVGRVEWNYSTVPLSYSSTNDIDKQNDTDFQNKYNSTILALKNVIPDGAEKPSRSTDPVSEEGVISGSKVKKTGGKKPKSKSVRISEPSITQNQPTSTSPEGSEGLNISREDLNAFYEKEAKRDKKNKAEVNRRLVFPI